MIVVYDIAPCSTNNLCSAATVESFWFGFRDDIVVRIRPAGTGSILDVRSTSRVGVSDLGANAKRVRAFLAVMRAAH